MHSSQHKGVIEGVAIVDGIVPQGLHENLNKYIDNLANLQEIPDYHPHSNNTVRDLVHPALYPYCKGISKYISKSGEAGTSPARDDESREKDSWGRPYEASLKYQWLPTNFYIDQNGSCKILEYINNLAPRSKYSDLYSSLEELFSHALPMFESVYTYGLQIRENLLDEDIDEPYDLP